MWNNPWSNAILLNMLKKSGFEAHGEFTFAFEKNYTLISASGSWNMACAEIYDSVLRKRVTSKPDLRRSVVIDGREWGLETPECGRIINELHHFIKGYYKALYLAYILSPDNMYLAKFILDSNNKGTDDVLTWKFYTDFPEAVSWLRSEGFTIPDLKSSDFPKPKPAEEYRKILD